MSDATIQPLSTGFGRIRFDRILWLMPAAFTLHIC